MQRVTPLDLIAVANELENEANLLPPSQIEHSTNLKNIAIMLESYQLKVITKIHHSVVSLAFVLSPHFSRLVNAFLLSCLCWVTNSCVKSHSLLCCTTH